MILVLGDMKKCSVCTNLKIYNPLRSNYFYTLCSFGYNLISMFHSYVTLHYTTKIKHYYIRGDLGPRRVNIMNDNI